jgi:DNA-binding transcriptional MocR family regulator
MSVRAMTWAFYDSKAKGLDRLVLLAIADHVHEDGRDAYPSIETLAAKCGIGKATVIRSIRSLEALGELQVERRGRGRGRIQTYRIVMEKSSGADLSGDDPQKSSFPQGSSPQAEKVQKRSADGDGKVPPRARDKENRSTEPEPRARARKNGNPHDSSTDRIPGYRHDDNAGHDPDPTDCSACGTAAGARRASKAVRRAALEAAGVPAPNDWPNGEAERPPIDAEAERERQKRVLAELIERGERP